MPVNVPGSGEEAELCLESLETFKGSGEHRKLDKNDDENEGENDVKRMWKNMEVRYLTRDVEHENIRSMRCCTETKSMQIQH